ncbi:MAG: hypothetical protein LBQ31_11035 [Bacteroidales bacterium]|jgi:hypothetical protein|nr:hypothetical protein [Bacteroidales bacterium]
MKTLLKILCILTFVWSGVMCVSYTVIAIPGDQFWTVFFEKFEDNDGFSQLQETVPNIDVVLAQTLSILQNTWYLLLVALFALGSVVGAAVMFKSIKSDCVKNRQLGFHIYTISHLLCIALPLLFSMPFNWSGTFFTLIIVGLYALVVFKKSTNTPTEL